MNPISFKLVLAIGLLISLTGIRRTDGFPNPQSNNLPLTTASPDLGPPPAESGTATQKAAVAANTPPAGSPAPQLGLFEYNSTPLERELMGIGPDARAIAGRSIAGSPAEAAGIQFLDSIESIDGQPISSYNELIRSVQKHAVGDVISLTLRRGKEVIQTRATLAPRSVNLAADSFRWATAGDSVAQFDVGMRYLTGLDTTKDPAKARFWLERAAENGVIQAWTGLAEIHAAGMGVPKNPEFARGIYELLAAEGDSAGQYNLADFARTGTGGPVDLSRALALYELVANQGQSVGRFRVGEFYATGIVVPRDDARAFQHFLRSAEMGNTLAAARVGNRYANGTGTPRDDAAAFKWLTIAAKDNIAAAQHDLGAIYSDGRGTPQDFGQTALWLSAASEQGYVPSMAALGRLYRNMQPPDYSKALKWLQKADAAGDLAACNLLGEMYAAGQGVPRDVGHATRFFTKSAEGGDSVAQYNLGLNYSEGAGVGQNTREAVKWLNSAIADPNLKSDARAKSLLILGTIYESQLPTSNVPRNHDWALDYYRQAAELKLLSAQRLYGQRLRDRRYYSDAVKWLNEAATRGDRAAQNDLGTMYYNGQGVAQSREQAIAWWIKAYEQGSTTARDSLRKIGVNAK